MPATLNDILGPDGSIARRLGRSVRAPAAAAGDGRRPCRPTPSRAGHHLMVEAGTGVGKSFAYLLPAIDYAVRNKKRVVISTHTISLQEQLIEKDIPLLAAVYPGEFSSRAGQGAEQLPLPAAAAAGGRAGRGTCSRPSRRRGR